MWIGVIATVSIVVVLLKDGQATSNVIKALGQFHTGAIEALQGRSLGIQYYPNREMQ